MPPDPSAGGATDGSHSPGHSGGPAHSHGPGHPHGSGQAGAGLRRARRPGQPLRVGVGGPVGSGKTALLACLCRSFGATVSVAAVTNDIYTTEDAAILRRAAVLPDQRIVAVQTGCCPHTAIRDDTSANLDAVEGLEATFPDLELILLESGGDNLTATFSYGLVDTQIFVIDVAGGDKVPRKGGPGITSADLLVVNKVDLAPLVGADLTVMARDAATQRGARPGGVHQPGGRRRGRRGGRMGQGADGVRAYAELSVGAGSPPRIERMLSAAPLRWRATPDAVYMVSTAAAPVGDDDVVVRINVGSGARLAVRSVAASVAWSGSGSRQRVEVEVGPGGHLDWGLEPLVVTAHCDHRQEGVVVLHPSASLRWAEKVVLGRHGEHPGRLRSTLHVDVGGHPLLRHGVEVGDGSPGWDGPAVLGPARALATVAVVDGRRCWSPASGPGWSVLPLDAPGALGVAVAPSAVELERALRGVDDALRAGAGSPAGG